MQIDTTPIADVVVLTPFRHTDERGYFTELYNEQTFAAAVGATKGFVQDNESLSTTVGTVRGLHYQLRPFAQSKLIRVSAGRLLDVCVDIRSDSPTFGRHVAVELDAASGRQLWAPAGMAHGFCTLEPDTVISYKVTDFYNAEADRSLRWDDPVLAIDWPTEADPSSVSTKDAEAPLLGALREAGELL